MERCWTCHGQGWYANQDGATIGCVYCKGSGVKWEEGEVYQRIAKLERERDALRQDKERLDWLESHLFALRVWMTHGNDNDGDTLRKFADRRLEEGE